MEEIVSYYDNEGVLRSASGEIIYNENYTSNDFTNKILIPDEYQDLAFKLLWEYRIPFIHDNK